MKRLFFFFLLIVGAVAVIHQVEPRLKQLSEDRSSSIRRLSQKVLQPLESKTSISDAAARKDLADLMAKVTVERPGPDTGRTLQALKLLGQALDERNVYLSNAKAGSAGNRLDEVPGDWHIVGHPEKKVNTTEIGHQRRSSFWTEAKLRQWRLRCDYYQAAIDALLASATPAPRRAL